MAYVGGLPRGNSSVHEKVGRKIILSSALLLIGLSQDQQSSSDCEDGHTIVDSVYSLLISSSTILSAAPLACPLPSAPISSISSNTRNLSLQNTHLLADNPLPPCQSAPAAKEISFSAWQDKRYNLPPAMDTNIAAAGIQNRRICIKVSSSRLGGVSSAQAKALLQYRRIQVSRLKSKGARERNVAAKDVACKKAGACGA